MNRQAILAALVLGAGLLIITGFFLPWMAGSNELEHRSFSGFDFARLIRNFEITAASESETGRIRAAALVLYLVPALAVNAAIFALLAWAGVFTKRIGAVAAAVAGAYGLLVLGTLLFLSIVHVNAFADVVGRPENGFALSAAGCTVMILPAIAHWRSPGPTKR